MPNVKTLKNRMSIDSARVSSVLEFLTDELGGDTANQSKTGHYISPHLPRIMHFTTIHVYKILINRFA